MNHTALPAVHRIEAEIVAGIFHAFRRGQRTDTQLFNTQRPVFVRVERDTRMIVGMHAQHFLADQFQCQQEFCPVAQQQIHVSTLKLDHQVRILKVRMTLVSGFDGKGKFEARRIQNLAKELFDPRTGFVN